METYYDTCHDCVDHYNATPHPPTLTTPASACLRLIDKRYYNLLWWHLVFALHCSTTWGILRIRIAHGAYAMLAMLGMCIVSAIGMHNNSFSILFNVNSFVSISLAFIS